MEQWERHEFMAEDAPDNKPLRILPVKPRGLLPVIFPGDDWLSILPAHLAACRVSVHVWFTSFALLRLHDPRFGYRCYLR